MIQFWMANEILVKCESLELKDIDDLYLKELWIGFILKCTISSMIYLFQLHNVGVIGLGVHIYVYIGPGAQSEDIK